MRTRLLFLYLYPSGFVLDDLRLLEETHDVRVFHFAAERLSVRGLPAFLLTSIRQLFWLLRELPRAGVVYGWFADYHMFLPALLARWYRRPLTVCLGGYDAHHLPRLGYGVFHSRWRAPLARFVLRRAALLLPVGKTLVRSENRFCSPPEARRTGILEQIPDLATPVRVLPTGYRAEAWPAGAPRRPMVVGISAYVASRRTAMVKGLDLFIRAAQAVPEAEFVVVGIAPERLEWVRRELAPAGNVRLLPARPREELGEFYCGLSVYLQPSRTEGLPNALCEAMLCGCIPVVSPVGEMPEVVGDAGFVLESPDPEEIARGVRAALALGADPDRGPPARARAREQIVFLLPLERRRGALREVLESLAHGDSIPSDFPGGIG